jgi:hypothetical protein
MPLLSAFRVLVKWMVNVFMRIKCIEGVAIVSGQGKEFSATVRLGECRA